jgi:hypothetical protein
MPRRHKKRAAPYGVNEAEIIRAMDRKYLVTLCDAMQKLEKRLNDSMAIDHTDTRDLFSKYAEKARMFHEKATEALKENNVKLISELTKDRTLFEFEKELDVLLGTE